MDRELFKLAVAAAENILEKNSSIGTKSELHVHAALKYYLQPDLTMHEIKRSGFICDAVNENGVIEIQTASFKRLKSKLEKLLDEGVFTVVYPVIRSKIITKVNSETGETSGRKSPKKANVYSVFRELYQVPEYVVHPNFRLKIITLDVREFRVEYPEKIPSKNRRKRAKNYVKINCIPTDIVEERDIHGFTDFAEFIPEGLEETFFSSDFARCAKIKRNEASSALRFLSDIGLVERIGRNKAGYLYCKRDVRKEG